MAPHWKDEARLITAAKQGRLQLEEQFAQEREQARTRQRRAGWSPQDERNEAREEGPAPPAAPG